MSKYDIFAISMSNLVELGPIFHPLWHMFPVRLILSGVLSSNYVGQIRVSGLSRRFEVGFWLNCLSCIHILKMVSDVPKLVYVKETDAFWAAAPKGRCPVEHRREFPDVIPSILCPSIRFSPPY